VFTGKKGYMTKETFVFCEKEKRKTFLQHKKRGKERNYWCSLIKKGGDEEREKKR